MFNIFSLYILFPKQECYLFFSSEEFTLRQAKQLPYFGLLSYTITKAKQYKTHL